MFNYQTILNSSYDIVKCKANIAVNSSIFIYFLHNNIYCRYALEAPEEALLMSIHDVYFVGI